MLTIEDYRELSVLEIAQNVTALEQIELGEALTELLTFALRPTSEFYEKIKVGRGKFMEKITKIRQARGPLPIELPRRRAFQLFYILSKFAQKMHEFLKVINFITFYYRYRQISCKIFLPSGGSAPEPPIIDCPYYIHYFSHN